MTTPDDLDPGEELRAATLEANQRGLEAGFLAGMGLPGAAEAAQARDEAQERLHAVLSRIAESKP